MQNVVVIVLSERTHLREEGLQRLRVLLVEYGVVDVVVLDLVAHAIVDRLLRVSNLISDRSPYRNIDGESLTQNSRGLKPL